MSSNFPVHLLLLVSLLTRSAAIQPHDPEALLGAGLSRIQESSHCQTVYDVAI